MFLIRSFIVVCFTFTVLGSHPGIAQTKRPAPQKTTYNPGAVRALDKEAEQLQKTFIDNLEAVATRYEEAGDLEKAQSTFGKVLELDPEREQVKERLDEMKNRVFKNNETEIDVDVTRGWITSNVKLQEGEVVRITAEGSYRLIMNAMVTPDGIAAEDIHKDMVSGISLGGLMGVVFPPPVGRKKSEPGTPFQIGTMKEFTPDQSGMLFLRLNVPSGTKSVGSVKVKVSGHFER